MNNNHEPINIDADPRNADWIKTDLHEVEVEFADGQGAQYAVRGWILEDGWLQLLGLEGEDRVLFIPASEIAWFSVPMLRVDAPAETDTEGEAE